MTVDHHESRDIALALEPVREKLVEVYAATPPGRGIPRVDIEVRTALQQPPDGLGPFLAAIVDASTGDERDDDTTMAVQLLGVVQAPCGLVPVLRLATRITTDSDDHLTTAVWHALVEYAPTSMDAIVMFMLEHRGELGLLPCLFNADVRDERLFLALLECLPASPASVANALGWYGDERALPPLLACLCALQPTETDSWCDAVDCLFEAIYQLGGDVSSLESLASSSASVRTRLAEERMRGEEVLDARRREARDPTTRLERRAELARDDDVETRVGLAYCDHTDPATLDILAGDEEPRVRSLAAAHANLSAEASALLARDADVQVRVSLAVSPHTSEPMRAFLRLDTDPDVRAAVVAFLPPDQLHAVKADPHPEVRSAAASRHDASVELLTELADDPHALVRETVAYHRRAPRSLVERLALDPVASVQAAARACLPGGDVFDARHVAHVSRERGLAVLQLVPIIPGLHHETDG